MKRSIWTGGDMNSITEYSIIEYRQKAAWRQGAAASSPFSINKSSNTREKRVSRGFFPALRSVPQEEMYQGVQPGWESVNAIWPRYTLALLSIVAVKAIAHA
jgi:hypothetical protein